MQRLRTDRAVVFATVSLLAVGLLAGCTTTKPQGAGEGSTGDNTASVPGVTSKEIALGALIPLTGVFAAGAKAQLAGVKLYWREINSNGGVCDGRKVTITPLDNGYDPQKTVTAYSDINSRVLGLQLSTGTPTTEAIVPQLEQDGMVAIPMSWSPDLLGKDSLLIPGTTYDVDMINAVDYLLEAGKLKSGDSIGYIYFQGDFGGAGLAGATYAAKAHDITVDPYQVDPSVTDLSSQISRIAKSQNNAIFISASPPLLANAAALSQTKGLDVPIVSPTPTYVPELLASPAASQLAQRVIVVSPYNAWSANAPGVKDLRESYKQAGDKSTPQQFFIAGYAAASLMHSALKATCMNGPLTRDSLKKEFAKGTSFQMNGLSANLSFTDRSIPPALSDYLLKVDKSAVGGLTPIMDQPFQGADAKPLLKGK